MTAPETVYVVEAWMEDEDGGHEIPQRRTVEYDVAIAKMYADQLDRFPHVVAHVREYRLVGEVQR